MVMRVGVVGLGLIGGSLALRLAHSASNVHVVAWNHHDNPYTKAKAQGIECVDSLEELVHSDLDVLFLCNPLKVMPHILHDISEYGLPEKTTLSDVGSVKGLVSQQVKEAGLYDQFVGAHPMAGNELSGFVAADASIYDNALWAVCVDEHTQLHRFMDVITVITQAVDNTCIVLNDEVHDKAAALISHMPHVVATAFINEIVDDPNRNIAALLAAGSWRDMTRVALTDPDRTRAMVEEDAQNVAQLLRSISKRLLAVADNLEEKDMTSLVEFFEQGNPFRLYKSGAVQNLVQQREFVADSEHWQQDLLDSAKKGERIISISLQNDDQIHAQAIQYGGIK
ncbi:MAG: prephenate dehydrogenase/arogenate dehydrogenase family protein [Bifidobacteriaceae bacterium]|nr:prephenate dehydrogenase/arogenate dehydrogenase family protein [Bifidobacteriaceae bacterium]